MPRDLAGRKGRTRYGNEIAEEVKTARTKLRQRMLEGIGEGGDELFDIYRKDFTDWDDQTQDDRDESIISRNFFDGIQWTDEEIDVLNDREQPVLTTNLIKPKIAFIHGSQVSNPVTYKGLPRSYNGMHDMDAQVATDALHAAADLAGLKRARRGVAFNVNVEGYGGACLYVDEFENAQPDIRIDHVDWDRLYYDPRSREPDFSDAQYLGIIVWMHREEAEEEFINEDMDQKTKDRIMGVLSASYARDQTHGDATQDAPRRWRDGDDRVQFFETYRKIEGEWTKAVWSWGGFIYEPEAVGGIDEDGRWGFVDDNGETFCPLILASAWVDRENARYGIVKDLISPQEEVNKRKSKALHLIHNKFVMSEVGAIQNPDEFAAELTKPDGNAQVLPGRLKDGSVVVQDNAPMAQGQFQMLDHAVNAVNAIGPHAALVAADQRAQSGAALTARQQAGAMEIKSVNDNLDDWTLRVGKALWYLIRVYWTDEMWVRVTDDEFQHGHRFVSLNRRMTKGERLQELMELGWEPDEALRTAMGAKGVMVFQRIMQEVAQEQQAMQQQQQMVQQAMQQAQQSGQQPPPEVLAAAAQMQVQQPPDPMVKLLETPLANEEFTENDVAKLDVDIVLELEPTTPTVREAQFMELLKLLQTTIPNLQNEELKLAIIGEMFKTSDLRADVKRKFSKLLAPKPPTPQEQQMQQMQMQQLQLQMQTMQAQMQKLQTESAKNEAQAQKLAIEAAQAIPAVAQLNQAKTDQVEAETQAVPSEVKLTEAQAQKAEAEAKVVTAPDNKKTSE